jgi:hypothetical protein
MPHKYGIPGAVAEHVAGFFLTPEDRAALRKSLEEQSNKPVNTPVPVAQQERVRERSPDVYVVVPPKGEGIPARVGDFAGSNACCLFRLMADSTLDPILDRTGKQVRVTVYNIYDQPVTPALPPDEYYIQVQRGKDGKWLCEQPVPRVTTSTTTTTTTPNALGRPCDGKCRWTWNNTTREWTQASSSCVTSTSSSTTTTSTSSTTTTCLCDTTTTTTPFGGTTSTSTTTTTYVCECTYPTFCGTQDGDCTLTNCGPIKGKKPECGQSTTTSTSTTTTTPIGGTTTTTPCDCGTTTTDSCNISTKCRWRCLWVPGSVGGWIWVPVNYDCVIRSVNPLTGRNSCMCESQPPPYCNLCDVYESNCVPVPTTTTTDGGGIGGCGGRCYWYWNPDTRTWFQGSFGSPDCLPWHITPNDCACNFPSYDGGDSCGFTFTECLPNPNSTTTSTTPVNPCVEQCYSSSTTTTTTSTTTSTVNCNSGTCLWKIVSGAWSLISSNCPSNCPCVQPPYNPVYTCEVRETPCGGETTTSTTTTSTSTTTTTPAPTTTTTTTTSTTSTTTTACDAYDEGFEGLIPGNWSELVPPVDFSNSTRAHTGTKSMKVGSSFANGEAEFTWHACGDTQISFWFYNTGDVDLFLQFGVPSDNFTDTFPEKNTWTQVIYPLAYGVGNYTVQFALEFPGPSNGGAVWIDDVQTTNTSDP